MVCTGPLNLGGKPTDASMILVSKPYKEMANSVWQKISHRYCFKIFFATIFKGWQLYIDLVYYVYWQCTKERSDSNGLQYTGHCHHCSICYIVYGRKRSHIQVWCLWPNAVCYGYYSFSSVYRSRYRIYAKQLRTREIQSRTEWTLLEFMWTVFKVALGVFIGLYAFVIFIGCLV